MLLGGSTLHNGQKLGNNDVSSAEPSKSNKVKFVCASWTKSHKGLAGNVPLSITAASASQASGKTESPSSPHRPHSESCERQASISSKEGAFEDSTRKVLTT